MSNLMLFSFILFALMLAFSIHTARAEDDAEFWPVLVSAEFTSREVRQGDRIGLTLKFSNEGAKAAKGDYIVFLHFEYPEFSCTNIKFQYDHKPTQPTNTWRPGEIVVDGPWSIAVPDDLPDGLYHVHVGIYAPSMNGVRFLDTKAGELKIFRSAQPSSEIHPLLLPRHEILKRRKNLAKRIKNPVTLDDRNYSFAMDRDSGAFQLLDKRTGVLWGSNPNRSWFGSVQLSDGYSLSTVGIEKFDSISKTENGLKASIKLLPTDITLNVFIEKASSEPEGLVFRYDTPNNSNRWEILSIRLLDNAFWTTNEDNGYAVVPFRLGEMLPTDYGLPTIRRYLTYSDSTMALYGAVKHGSALLLAWSHPDTTLEVQTSWPDLPLVSGRRMHSASIVLKGDARQFSVHPLGKGSYVDIGKAYRNIARQNGWLMTWAEKRKDFPTVEKMFGAADFKPFVFSRTVPSSRFNNTGKEQTHVSYTFQEAAQVAEHLNRDLEIDKAMYVLAGWINRGYDNQHPDILPAAPECGGDKDLADCAKRVKDCGFLFGLHDNYQDMYEDAPSWDIKYLNKDTNGKPKMGGNWAGGQGWQVCAIEQVNLAARPGTNLPKIAQLFGPSTYFIDTTFAWGLVTCEDPEHPMSRWDDMKWKSRLCDLAKEYFGLFGSEEGREWAIPHSDYMEGLLSHKIAADRQDRSFARQGDGIVIPLFEIIYGDCINLYAHQGDRATPDRPDYILGCLLYGEMPVYDFGQHLYYDEDRRLPITVSVSDFRQISPGKVQLTYKWVASDDIKKDYNCFVHFTHPEGERDRENIAFQDDHALPKPSSTWKAGDVIIDGPRTVEVPEKYHGRCDLWIGLFDGDGRAELKGLQSSNGRHYIGSLIIDGEKITFKETTGLSETRCFARSDNGWGQGLNETDRFIKNTYEVLSYTNRLTAETPMTDHGFLKDDGSVEWSQFGDVQVWANYGSEEYMIPPINGTNNSETILPQYGFLVASPTFIAFHAIKFGGLEYEKPVLFTIQTLDGKPIEESQEIRIYHGFGDAKIYLADRRLEIDREEVVR